MAAAVVDSSGAKKLEAGVYYLHVYRVSAS
jgi:hypothetical protein